MPGGAHREHEAAAGESNLQRFFDREFLAALRSDPAAPSKRAMLADFVASAVAQPGRQAGCAWNRLSSFADFFFIGDGLGRNDGNGFAHERAQLSAASCHVVDNLAAHSSLPEIAEVIGDSIEGFVLIWIAREVGADIVSHHDEVMNIHRMSVATSYAILRVQAAVATARIHGSALPARPGRR